MVIVRPGLEAATSVCYNTLPETSEIGLRSVTIYNNIFSRLETLYPTEQYSLSIHKSLRGVLIFNEKMPRGLSNKFSPFQQNDHLLLDRSAPIDDLEMKNDNLRQIVLLKVISECSDEIELQLTDICCSYRPVI